MVGEGYQFKNQLNSATTARRSKTVKKLYEGFNQEPTELLIVRAIGTVVGVVIGWGLLLAWGLIP